MYDKDLELMKEAYGTMYEGFSDEHDYPEIVLQDNHGGEFYPAVYRLSNGMTGIKFKAVDGETSDIGGWSLYSILRHAAKHDKLFLDAGQNWYLTGVSKLSDIIEN